MTQIRLRSVIALLLVMPLYSTGAEYIAYIGTSGSNSKGIYAFHFDSKSGKLDAMGLVGETSRPSFIALHPNNHYLYAVTESKEGAVSAFRTATPARSRWPAPISWLTYADRPAPNTSLSE